MEKVGPDDGHKAIARAIANAGGCTISHLGLRFDRVAVRVLDELANSVEARSSEGVAVILTITAPIRMSKQVVSVLREAVAVLVRADVGGLERSVTFAEGDAKLRLVDDPPRGAPKLLGFVHNPSVDPARIINLAENWMRSLV